MTEKLAFEIYKNWFNLKLINLYPLPLIIAKIKMSNSHIGFYGYTFLYL